MDEFVSVEKPLWENLLAATKGSLHEPQSALPLMVIGPLKVAVIKLHCH